MYKECMFPLPSNPTPLIFIQTTARPLNTTRRILQVFNMHASSIIALALGATAVSATVLPRQADACNGQFCQFPKTIDCPVANGKGVTRAILEETVKNSKRVGAPYELSASNLATKHCMSPDFRDIPLWAVSSFSLFFRFLFIKELTC